MLFTRIPLQKGKYLGKSLEVKAGEVVPREKGVRIYCFQKGRRRKRNQRSSGSRKKNQEDDRGPV